jgi:hypothetical protein
MTSFIFIVQYLSQVSGFCVIFKLYAIVQEHQLKQYAENADKTDGTGFAVFISGHVCFRRMKEKSTFLLSVVGRLRTRFETL